MLINLVQSNQFTGRQDPHNHLRFFKKVTSTFRHPEVPNIMIKLLLFPFSLEGEARMWLDKEPPRSILTWEDLVSKFINQFFPPSKTTYLRNEIKNFLQKPNETFNEALEHFKDLLRQCPHHGFSELHQLDTFYNALNPNDQDALDSAAGGNFLDKIPRECLSIIESKSKQIIASLEDKLDIHMNRFEKSLNDMKNSFITPTALIKAVEEKVEQINKIDFIDAGGIGFDSEEIENFLNDDSVPLGVEDSPFNMEEDILFLESLLIEDPSPPHSIILNQTKSLIKEPKHSFNMGYKHFNTNLVINEVAESSTKNLVPIPRESKVISNDGSKSIEPVKDDFLVFTTISNPLFDNDKINSDELNSYVESNFDESTSNHDTVKFDNHDKFSGPLIPIYIVEEERIRRDHADYINRMEMLFTSNPHPHPLTNANTNIESFSSLPFPIQDSDPHWEEIDVVTVTDDVLPPSIKNDDSDREVDAVGDLRVDNSISNSEHEYPESEDSDFDNPLFECIDARVKFDVFNDENDDLSYFMFVIFDKMFSLLSAESEDTIFDPGEARIWLDKEPRRSILTWEDLVSKFINQFFPPSKTTYLRNEITNFLQKPNETFNEAWERFKDLLRQCLHHGFYELHRLDTFYNALNPNDQDALDSAARGNFLDKIPRECLSIIESKSKVRYSRSRTTDSRANTNAPLSSSLPSNSFDLQQIAAPLEDKLDICMNRFETKTVKTIREQFIKTVHNKL
nr:reverse transcriptase domain-containing protein [Tanacetum cinerariifolium]